MNRPCLAGPFRIGVRLLLSVPVSAMSPPSPAGFHTVTAIYAPPSAAAPAACPDAAA